MMFAKNSRVSFFVAACVASPFPQDFYLNKLVFGYSSLISILEILKMKFPINLFHSSIALDFFHLTAEDRNGAAYRNFTSFHLGICQQFFVINRFSVKQSVQKSIKMRPATMIQTKSYNVRESYKCADDSAGEVEIHSGEKVRVLIKDRVKIV